jgi:hypothetical protein
MIKMDCKYDKKEFEKANQELLDDMDKTIYDIADQIMAISQRIVPVDTHTLQLSQNIRYGRGYAMIGYNTPYAERIHDGDTQRDVIVPAHNRREHTRKLESGLVISVRAHGVRTHIMTMPEITGRPYLDNAIKAVLRDLPEDVRNSISVTRMEVEF